MPDDVALLHFGNDAVENVKVRAANSSGRYLYDGIARRLNFRIGNSFATNVAFTVPAQRFHVLEILPANIPRTPSLPTTRVKAL